MTQEKDIKKTKELSREELSNVAGGAEEKVGGGRQWLYNIPKDNQNEQHEAALI